MASARGQILPAERLGKHKTSWQIITVVFFLVLLSARELKYATDQNDWWFRAWNQSGPVLVWIAVGFTVYSGLRYAWLHRDVIAPDQ
jgi:CDP-diacylglycerol--glycerol-3-phosphate 3-phosphatidyltransferase/cardiolipin synthase